MICVLWFILRFMLYQIVGAIHELPAVKCYINFTVCRRGRRLRHPEKQGLVTPKNISKLTLTAGKCPAVFCFMGVKL